MKAKVIGLLDFFLLIHKELKFAHRKVSKSSLLTFHFFSFSAKKICRALLLELQGKFESKKERMPAHWFKEKTIKKILEKKLL